MTVRLVDAGWAKELAVAARADCGTLKMICPFIKVGALDHVLSARPSSIQVITRFSLADFAGGVSDVAALRKLLDVGAKVKGVRNLHAKLYMFGTGRAIVTSANLTEAGINRNHEFGLVADDDSIISACHAYFDRLWRRSGPDLTCKQLAAWDETVTRHRALGGRIDRGTTLPDFGVGAGFETPTSEAVASVIADAPQAFVKLLGKSDNRVSLSFRTVDEIDRAGCHWAVAYPAARKPTRVENGAIIFIARLTEGPNDIRVFGRAIGMKYQAGRDDATSADIESRPWKAKWPRYIRVHDAEFVAGTMANGVSLNEMMAELRSDAFLPTQRNAHAGTGNTDPRKAYRQQAHIRLSREGLRWLSERVQRVLFDHGTVPQDTLDGLDHPILP